MTRAQNLLEQLTTYEPADSIETEHCRAMLALLQSSADPFSRAHFVPGHFTASCFIVDDGGRLLLHHHRRLQRWLQMGGHVEGREALAAAALREGSEESGLGDLELVGAGIVDLDVHAIPPARGEPGHDHFDVRYVARTTAPDAVTMDRAESNELAWFTLDRAAELMPGAESIRVFRKIERLISGRST